MSGWMSTFCDVLSWGIHDDNNNNDNDNDDDDDDDNNNNNNNNKNRRKSFPNHVINHARLMSLTMAKKFNQSQTALL